MLQWVIGSNLVIVLMSLVVFHSVLCLSTLLYIPDQIKKKMHSSEKRKSVIIAGSVIPFTGMVIL